MNRAPVRFELAALAAVVVLSGAIAARQQPAQPSLYVTSAADALVTEGLALAAPAGPAAAEFVDVPAPSVRNAPNSGYAQATLAPWVESNGWRFQRGVRKARYSKLPKGASLIAAAEAFAYGVDAILDPDSADVHELGALLRFLKSRAQPQMPAMANIGVVDDGSAALPEALNMLTRRNLLYRIVSKPERDLDLTVQLGTRDFPKEIAANPSDFAARVREKLGDDKRLVRIFGSNTTIARLTGDASRGRLYLLSYSRTRAQEELRIRLRGRWQPTGVAAHGAAASKAADVQHVDNATEFTVPAFNTIAIVDLGRTR